MAERVPARDYHWSTRPLARASLAVLLATLLALSVVPSASAGSNTWTRLGGAGKLVGGLAVAPSGPNVLYVRTPEGLLRSSDLGSTWKLAGRRLGAYREGYGVFYGTGGDNWGWTVWIDPKDPRIVYSTLDESPGFWGGHVPTSLERSADGGRTWRRVLEGDGGQVAFYPGDPRIGYVAGSYGIWKSADRGLTWSQVYYLGARDLAIHPKDPSFVLAISGDYLIKSTDGGKTWNSLPRPIDQAFYRSDRAIVVGGGSQPLYWSLDGETWALLEGWANPLNPAEVFGVGSLGGEEKGAPQALKRSTDAGLTFSQFPAPPGAQGIRDLEFDYGTPQTLYALTDDGLWSYTFGKAPVVAADALPRTGSPEVATPSILAVLAAALALAGLRLRGRRGTRDETANLSGGNEG